MYVIMWLYLSWFCIQFVLDTCERFNNSNIFTFSFSFDFSSAFWSTLCFYNNTLLYSCALSSAHNRRVVDLKINHHCKISNNKEKIKCRPMNFVTYGIMIIITTIVLLHPNRHLIRSLCSSAHTSVNYWKIMHN